jgi:protein-S-isoprenylcysteine O-methyltransferase Ste14
VNTLSKIVLNLVLSLLVIAFAVLALRLDRFFFPGNSIPRLFAILAWPLFLVGSALIISAVYTLIQSSGTSGAPGDPTHQLVTTGLYRWMRNPIYLGDILLLFGVAFYTRSITYFLVAVLFIPAINLVVSKVEEPNTQARFGESYLQYKQATPRWIPKFRKPDADPNRRTDL